MQISYEMVSNVHVHQLTVPFNCHMIDTKKPYNEWFSRVLDLKSRGPYLHLTAMWIYPQ